MSRDKALAQSYIEANPTAVCSLVMTDRDEEDAAWIAADLGLPVPSWVALNPHTKFGHIGYALGTPVCLTDAARRAPVNLLARVEAGLTTALGGDVAYAHKFTKNPHHSDHLTLWGPDTAVYSLGDLAGALDELGTLPVRATTTKQRRETLIDTSTGRNVELFELVRKWAYPRRGNYSNLSDWEQAVQDQAWDWNVTVIRDNFSKGPMLPSEVAGIGRSVARWTWRKIKRTKADEFSRKQTFRAQMGWTEERRAAKAAETSAVMKRHHQNRAADRTDALFELGIVGPVKSVAGPAAGEPTAVAVASSDASREFPSHPIGGRPSAVKGELPIQAIRRPTPTKSTEEPPELPIQALCDLPQQNR